MSDEDYDINLEDWAKYFDEFADDVEHQADRWRRRQRSVREGELTANQARDLSRAVANWAEDVAAEMEAFREEYVEYRRERHRREES